MEPFNEEKVRIVATFFTILILIVGMTVNGCNPYVK